MAKMVCFLLLLFFTITTLEAASPFRQYKLTWRVRDGQIDLSSVCENYGYGTVEYRGCRAQAQEHFKQKCEEFGAKVANSAGDTQKAHRRKERTFCLAASQFTPVN